MSVFAFKDLVKILICFSSAAVGPEMNVFMYLLSKDTLSIRRTIFGLLWDSVCSNVNGNLKSLTVYPIRK